MYAAQSHTSESVFRSGNTFFEYCHLVLPCCEYTSLSIHPPPSHVPILENGKVGVVHKIYFRKASHNCPAFEGTKLSVFSSYSSYPAHCVSRTIESTSIPPIPYLTFTLTNKHYFPQGNKYGNFMLFPSNLLKLNGLSQAQYAILISRRIPWRFGCQIYLLYVHNQNHVHYEIIMYRF